MNGYIDLHIHSTASDGSLDPIEIIENAIKKNLKAISITDHDTIDGVVKAIKFNKNRTCLEIISGVEFSVKYMHRMHILGYYMDLNSSILVNLTENIKTQRHKESMARFQKLKLAKINITQDEVKKRFGSIHKHSIADYMVEKGYVESKQEAFDKYLEKGKIAYVKKEKISLQDAVMGIKESGGIAVLAHPSHLCNSELELDELLSKMKCYGIDGIEAYHPDNSPEFSEICLRMANKYDLLITGGSDFHGLSRNERELGIIREKIMIPYKYAYELKRFKEKRQRES